MKKSLRTVSVALAAVCLLFTGCRSAEHKASFNHKAGWAVNYMEQKYGETLTVVDSGYFTTTNVFGTTPTDDFWYTMSDGTTLIWEDGQQDFRDNRQSEQICRDAQEFLNGKLLAINENIRVCDLMINAVGYEGGQPDFMNTPASAYEYRQSFFHNKYDGDIEAFLHNSPVQINAASSGGRILWEIEDDASQRESAVRSVEKAWLPYISYSGLDFGFVSTELYEKLAASEIYRPLHIGDEGCYEILEYFGSRKKQNHLTQNYEDIGCGIMAATGVPGLSAAELLTAAPAEPQEEVQRLLDERSLARGLDYKFTAASGGYELQLNKEYLQQAGMNTDYVQIYFFIPGAEGYQIYLTDSVYNSLNHTVNRDDIFVHNTEQRLFWGTGERTDAPVSSADSSAVSDSEPAINIVLPNESAGSLPAA